MLLQAFVVWVVVQLTSVAVNGEGCSAVTTSGRPVLNMCESGTWPLGVVYVSVNITSMGTSTRCSCTVSGQTQGQEITTIFTMEDTIPSIKDCTQTVFKVETSGASREFICQTVVTPPSVSLITTERTTLTLSRPSPLYLASLCISVIPNNHAANNIILTCHGDLSATSTQPLVTTQMTSFQTVKSTNTPSSSSSASSSTASSPRPLVTATSDATPPTTSDVVVTSDIDVRRCDSVGTSQLQSESTPVAVIVVAVVGWLLALGLAAGHLALFLRRKPKTSSAPGAENSAYTSLSDITRVNPRADPSYAVVQPERGSTGVTGSTDEGARGVYETVDRDSSVSDRHLTRDVRQETGTYCNA